MPILINDHSWRQTMDMVIIRVPLRNIPHTRVDLLHSDKYIKVHFPPFLFECALYEPINEDDSKCTLVQGEAVFELAKSEKQDWPSLQKDVTKQEMVEIKKQAIEHVQERAEYLKNKKQENLRKKRDACIGQQIALDGERRSIIDNKKAEEKKKAFDEIMEWKQNDTDKDFLPSPVERAASLLKSIQGKKTNDRGIKKIEYKNHLEVEKINLNTTLHENSKEKKIIEADKAEEKDIWKSGELEESSTIIKIPKISAVKKPMAPTSKKKEHSIPPLRQTGSINVEFTYRAFPTPSRESKLKEEQEWLLKQKEARRKTGFMVEDLSPEENDPVWLLEKGKSFHNAGNYLGAISAFSHAIQTWNKIPELYVARSNSHMNIGNFRRVLEDTTHAVDLLKPHVDSNAELRFQAHYNRGKALLELGQASSSMAEFVEALAIHPYREDVHNLMDRAESDAQAAKELASRPSEQSANYEKEFIEPEVLAN